MPAKGFRLPIEDKKVNLTVKLLPSLIKLVKNQFDSAGKHISAGKVAETALNEYFSNMILDAAMKKDEVINVDHGKIMKQIKEEGK